MPRIVYLVSSFPKLSETFILSKFLGLLERGWDVHVVCWESQPGEWQKMDKRDQARELQRRVHVSWPQRPRWLALLLVPFALLRCLALAPTKTIRYLKQGWKRLGLDIFRRLYLDAEIVVLQPDLLHIEFGSLSPERMYLKELLNCKILVSFRGYDLNFVQLDDPVYYQQVWEKADALHLLGQDLWKRAQQRGCRAEKVHMLIPPAIDTDFFTPPVRESLVQIGTTMCPLRILSVGRLEWKKGYEFAFEAVHLLEEQGLVCEYRVIGDGEYYEALAFARHQWKLENTIRLMGAQSHEQVRDQLIWADVFLHSAVSEGFCNAVLEAQSMGIPVVCSDADGLPENVQDGLTGFVTPRRCPQTMAEKLARLAHDPGLRQQMGEAGRQRVLGHFQVSNQLHQFEELYIGLLGDEDLHA